MVYQPFVNLAKSFEHNACFLKYFSLFNVFGILFVSNKVSAIYKNKQSKNEIPAEEFKYIKPPKATSSKDYSVHS